MQALSQLKPRFTLAPVLRAAAVVFALGMYSASASAGTPGIPKLPEPSTARGLANHWSIADLDGDRRPDIASSSVAGIDIQGFLYRVEVQLSDGLPNGSFMVSTSSRLGLNILPRDVDGDHDLDLVITSGALRQPVGVWINDGHGGFNQADPSLFPVQDRSEELVQLQPATDESCLFSTDETQRPCFASPSTSIHGPPANRVSLKEVAVSALSSTDHARDNLTRGPPVLLLS